MVISNEEGVNFVEPIHTDSVKELEIKPGPSIEAEAKDIQDKMGFRYRDILGGIIFDYVVVRLYISYAVAELSRFSDSQAECNYVAINRVVRYLRQDPKRGIIWWRKEEKIIYQWEASFQKWTWILKYQVQSIHVNMLLTLVSHMLHFLYLGDL